MCIKALYKHLSTVKYVSNLCKTDGIGIRAVNTCSFVFVLFPDWYKTQEIQEMYDKTVDNNQTTLDFVLIHTRVKACVIKLLMITYCIRICPGSI